MTNRFYSPDQQFLSNSGVPYAGGQLFFYATGTSTPQNTYSDQALTVANTNPVILDSNGQAGSIFLQNLAYKVVLEDVNSVQVWTMDPVYTSDYSTFAQFQPWGGNPNGQVAGFAGTQGALPPTSAVWDYVDNILYICTTTGNAASAVWTAVNPNSATAGTSITPQGYLTISNDPNEPIVASDITGSTSVYYTPYTGNQLPIYNGVTISANVFTQLTLSLTSSQAGSTLYDVFVFSNSGVLTLVTGPAWSASTGGSSTRGTGAGTTALQKINGLWVNGAQITGKNGSTSYTIASAQATYLGTILIDSTAGQVSCFTSYGQNRKWGVWNCYNRKTIVCQAGDATSSWTIAGGGSGAFRTVNGNSANSVIAFTGLPEESYHASSFLRFSTSLTANLSSNGFSGIGFNNTSPTASGTAGEFGLGLGSGVSGAISYSGTAIGDLVNPPALGVNTYYALEAFSGSGGPVATGGIASNNMTVTWRG